MVTTYEDYFQDLLELERSLRGQFIVEEAILDAKLTEIGLHRLRNVRLILCFLRENESFNFSIDSIVERDGLRVEVTKYIS